tara:strand:- start:273 stop:479 length:207 start_codon:yes stop_codon:yes gene_type:complete
MSSSYIYWSPEKQEWDVTFNKAVADANVPKKDDTQVYVVLIGVMCVLMLLLYTSVVYTPTPIPPDYRF